MVITFPYVDDYCEAIGEYRLPMDKRPKDMGHSPSFGRTIKGWIMSCTWRLPFIWGNDSIIFSLNYNEWKNCRARLLRHYLITVILTIFSLFIYRFTEPWLKGTSTHSPMSKMKSIGTTLRNPESSPRTRQKLNATRDQSKRRVLAMDSITKEKPTSREPRRVSLRR